jgi:hypothetical protein
MSEAMRRFSELAGVPVRYDRSADAPYGSRGRPHRFVGQRDFVSKLDRLFEELWLVCGSGTAEVITSAGAFTRKPGQHGLGRAFDLDAIFWSRNSFVTLDDGFGGRDRRLYFGIECVIRKHFGQVLNYDYDVAHRDHFHIDDAQPVGFRPESRALMLFLQGTLAHVHHSPLGIDGVCGHETAQATRQVLSRLGIAGDLSAVEVWRDFLSASAQRAMLTTPAT